MDRHSQEDEEFGGSLTCLDAWDQGMQSPELQEHLVGNGIAAWGIISPVQNPQKGFKQRWELRNSCKSPCLGTVKEAAPALWTGHHHRSRIEPLPGPGGALPRSISAVTSLPNGGARQGVWSISTPVAHPQM